MTELQPGKLQWGEYRMDPGDMQIFVERYFNPLDFHPIHDGVVLLMDRTQMVLAPIGETICATAILDHKHPLPKKVAFCGYRFSDEILTTSAQEVTFSYARDGLLMEIDVMVDETHGNGFRRGADGIWKPFFHSPRVTPLSPLDTFVTLNSPLQRVHKDYLGWLSSNTGCKLAIQGSVINGSYETEFGSTKFSVPLQLD